MNNKKVASKKAVRSQSERWAYIKERGLRMAETETEFEGYVRQAIIARRVELGVTIRNLSESAGISYATVYNYERGHQSMTMAKLSRLMVSLGLEFKLITG